VGFLPAIHSEAYATQASVRKVNTMSSRGRNWVFTALIAGFSVGVVVGAYSYYRLVTNSHSARLSIASESAEATYLLYRYAPLPEARRALQRHTELIRQLVEDASGEAERSSYLRDLAVNIGRLALLEEREGEIREGAKLRASAMKHLEDSGSTWTEQELFNFIVTLDEAE